MREGAFDETLLSDGREVVVYPLTFRRARLVVGSPGSEFVDDAW